MARNLPHPPSSPRSRTSLSTRLTGILIATLVAAVALAGCTADRGDDDDRVAQLEFSGSGSGMESDTADCDDDGLLTATGSVQEGNLTITVWDGGDNELFSADLNGTLTGEGEGLDGEAGQWTLQVERSDDFDGQYIVNLGC